MQAKIPVILLSLTLIVLASFAYGLGAAIASTPEFTDVRQQTQEFMVYNDSITLTPEQQKVFDQALDAIPAPCCSDNTARTCCCPCNMAKTWWGLAKHLIADEGQGAAEVQAAVEGWIEFINPDGFSGDVCYSAGGCGRAFHENGCGGMNPSQVAF